MPLRTRLRVVHAEHGPGDRGSALVVAVAVCLMAALLGAVVVSAAIGLVQDSGVDRQRTAAVHAAEAGIDQAYYALHTGTPPCPSAAPTAVSFGGVPDETEVRTRIEYFDAANVPLTGCPVVAPAKAVITATATATRDVGAGRVPRRVLQSEVLLSPASGGQGYAIYSYGSLTVPNSFRLRSDGSASADVYARGGLTCTNGAEISGSVFSSVGGAVIGNTCSILGDLYVRDAITQTGNSTLGAALSSRAGLSIANASTVNRDVTVRTSVTGSPSSVRGTIRSGQSIADPVDQPLPYIGKDVAGWSATHTPKDYGADCARIKSEMFTVTTPTVFYGDCALAFSGNNSGLRLKTDVALFLTGGMTIENNFGLASDDPARTRRLHVISPAGPTPVQPVGWTPATCTGGDIVWGNHTDVDRSVNVFLYSCGRVDVANNSEFSGQVYGREVRVANAFDMTFVPLPSAVLQLGGAPAVPGFKVEVVYKRETR